MTIKVDLLPTEKKRFGIDPVMIFLVLIIILFTAGFFVYGKTLESNIEKRNQEVADIEKQIQDVRSKLPGIQKMKDDNAKLQAEIQTIQGLRNDPVRYANLLWELAEVLPQNVWVNSVNVDPGQQSVVLSGSAITYGQEKPLESIALLMRNLETSRYYRDASLSSTSMSKFTAGVGFNFQIETHYDADAALKSPDQIAPAGAAPAPGASPSPGASPAASPAPGSAPPHKPPAKGGGAMLPQGGKVGVR